MDTRVLRFMIHHEKSSFDKKLMLRYMWLCHATYNHSIQHMEKFIKLRSEKNMLEIKTKVFFLIFDFLYILFT